MHDGGGEGRGRARQRSQCYAQHELAARDWRARRCHGTDDGRANGLAQLNDRWRGLGREGRGSGSAPGRRCGAERTISERRAVRGEDRGARGRAREELELD